MPTATVVSPTAAPLFLVNELNDTILRFREPRVAREVLYLVTWGIVRSPPEANMDERYTCINVTFS